MFQAYIQPYLDMLMQHLSDLMVVAETWPDTAQTHLYAFWNDLDQLNQLLTQSQLPIRETRFYLGELWQELSALEQLTLYGDVFWHLSELSKSLVSVSQTIDEHLCSQFELPVIAINSMDTIELIPVSKPRN